MPLLDANDVLPVLKVHNGRVYLVVYRPVLSLVALCVDQKIRATGQTRNCGHLYLRLSCRYGGAVRFFWDITATYIKPDVGSCCKDNEPEQEPEV